MTYYLYCETEEEFVKEFKSLPEAEEIRFFPFSNGADLHTLDLSDATHIITSATLPQIKIVMLISQEQNLSLGIVPLPSQSRITKILDLPSKKTDAFTQALQPAERKIDMFFCNDMLVLDDVRIGDASILKEFEYDYVEHSFWERLRRFWRNFRDKAPLRHHSFRIKTAKDDEKQFSAVGIIALDYDNRSWMASALKSHLGSGDGQHVLAILAPRSLWQFYVKQPIDILLGRKSKSKLPKSLGFVKNSSTYIESSEPLEALIDDSLSMQTPVELRTVEGALALSVGEKFWERQTSTRSTKSNIRLDNIPKDEEQMEYLSQGLPLFEHASKEQYSSLFTTLREEAQTSSTFMILLILATLIATLGLFINSGSVIIGAMLLAPLMQPIVSLSMGVLRQDTSMQKNAIWTISIGVIAVLVSAALVAYMVTLQRLTPEMTGRLSPTILDLFVAIVSGVAAAYVKNNEKILSSLAGVAIAVALVPPIAVAGIGIGWGEWHIFYSSFLLFITNLAGIVLAASVTFMLLGYSPIHIAKKGLFIWLFIVAFIAIPLYTTFGQMRENAKIQNTLTHTYFSVGEKKLELSHVEILRHKGKLEVRCEVISDGVLADSDKEYLKDVIAKSVGKDIDIIATFRYRL
jgi:uncharacterized hydrophobic protein (TIGR00271 family)